MFYVETPNAVEEQVHDVTFKGHLQHQNQDKKSQENDDKSSATQQEGIQSKSFFCKNHQTHVVEFLLYKKRAVNVIFMALALQSAEKKNVKNVMYLRV